jgi:hypothetical protein
MYFLQFTTAIPIKKKDRNEEKLNGGTGET